MAFPKRRKLKLFLVILILVFAVGAGIFMAVTSAANRGATGFRTTESLAQDRDEAGYDVTMSPVGTVHFKRPPQRIVTQDANYNDMLVAVGSGANLIATGYQNNFFDGFYAQLQGVKPGIDPQSIQYLSAGSGALFDKELLYKLRADIHHIDPLQLATSRNWTSADIAEITHNVGPFFANRYSRENIYAGSDPYEFYTVWELADKVGQVYRKSDRIAKLKEIGDALERKIRAKLPPPEQRPSVGLIYYGNGRITPYSLLHNGFGQAQYVAVGARDAFEGKNISTYGDAGGRGTALDLEGLLSIDPEVLIMPLAIYGKPGSGQGARAAYEQLLKLKDNQLGHRLTAFKRDQVYPGGTPLQGPVFYIFQVEMAAKQIYPELFGRYRDDQRYPPEECLFDREAVAKILRGEADHAGN